MIRFITALVVALSSFAAQAAMDVNKASQADLESLRGVGPGLSGKIVEARKAGDFKNWGDLVDRVAGIGPASASKLSQGGLTVAGVSYSPDAAAKPKSERSRRAADGDKPAKPSNNGAAKDGR